MKKGNIVVVEASSTGFNYVEDIIKRGYEPIVLETWISSPDVREYFLSFRKQCYSNFPKEVTIIPAKETYEEALAAVKEFDPVLIFAGEENGVELAAHLASDLGLPGIDYNNIDRYIKKSAMHQTLIEHGIRGIRGRLVKSVEEAVAFAEELGSAHVVVKPTRSAGSQGLKLCSSIEEMKEGVQALLENVNYFGEKLSDVLIQERIYGTEFFVDTVSRHGKHRLTSIWKYDKIRTERGGYIYNTGESVTELEPGHTELVEYAFSVLEALEVKDGPVHAEYMIDKKGPVLIEVNCRPMGLSMPAEFLNQIIGHHETDFILDAFLDEKSFEEGLKKPYKLLRKGLFKMFITPKETLVEALPVRVILKHMRSVFKTSIPEETNQYLLPKTEDLNGSAGVVYMVHDDPDVVMTESAFLHELETKYFRMLFHGTGHKETPLKADCLSLKEVMEMTHCKGSTLVVSDDPEADSLEAMVVSTAGTEAALAGFDQVILDIPEYGEGSHVEKCVECIFTAMKKVRSGGRLIVPERFYQHIPYGRNMIEALMIIGGFKVMAPVFGMHDVVCGSR